MDYHKAPQAVRDFLDGLEHASATIACDVQDAFEDADDLEGFVDAAYNALHTLISECIYTQSVIYGLNHDDE